MKTFIATAAIALSMTAPAFADPSDARALLALSNDSAAERIIGSKSTGNTVQAAQGFALSNDSAAETTIIIQRARNVDSSGARAFFALSNDSAAERIAN